MLLISIQIKTKLEDNFPRDVDFFIFAWYNERNEKTGQEGEYESRTDDIGFLAGYGHI